MIIWCSLGSLRHAINRTACLLNEPSAIEFKYRRRFLLLKKSDAKFKVQRKRSKEKKIASVSTPIYSIDQTEIFKYSLLFIFSPNVSINIALKEKFPGNEVLDLT